MTKVLILVPAYNEAGQIKNVLADLQKHGYRNILVVDDGSGDNTSDLAKKKAKWVLRHVQNRGLGAALGTGFEFARLNDVDVLVTFDADAQHKASDIKKLIDPILKKRYDVVIGSRSLDFRSAPVSRRVLNYLSNLATFLVYGVWTTDSLSGLRAFNKTAYVSIQIKTDRMEVSNEFFREIKRNKLRFCEVPIKAIYTDYSRINSKNAGNPLVVWWTIGWKIILRLFR